MPEPAPENQNRQSPSDLKDIQEKAEAIKTALGSIPFNVGPEERAEALEQLQKDLKWSLWEACLDQGDKPRIQIALTIELAIRKFEVGSLNARQIEVIKSALATITQQSVTSNDRHQLILALESAGLEIMPDLGSEYADLVEKDLVAKHSTNIHGAGPLTHLRFPKRPDAGKI